MNKITLYLAKNIAVTIALVVVLFVGLELVFSLVTELRVVGTGQYAMSQAFGFILLSLPDMVVQVFPMAALVGTLLGLGTLASRSELIVMRSAGLSIQAIIFAIFKLAIVLVILNAIIGEVIAPVLDKWAHQQKAIALSDGQALRTVNGIWMREKDDFIHIQSMPSAHRLEGVTRYEFDDAMKLKRSSFAKTAHYENGAWVLHDIRETTFADNRTSHQTVESMPWESHIDPTLLSLVQVKDIDELSLKGLWQTIDYRRQNHLDPKPYQLAFWQKLFRPIATLVMMFLAIPFIFGPLRQSSMGLRVLVGVFVGFAFYTCNELFGPLTLLYPVPPVIGASLPIMVFFIVGMLMLKRAR